MQNADVLGLKFIDVYWTEKDLTEEEQNYFVKHGSADARRVWQVLSKLNTPAHGRVQQEISSDGVYRISVKRKSKVSQIWQGAFYSECPGREHFGS